MVRIIGCCHPKARSQTYVGPQLSWDRMKHSWKKLRGQPILDNHNTERQVGQVLDAWIDGEKQLWIMAEIDEKTSMGRTVASRIRSGEYRGLSLGMDHMVLRSLGSHSRGDPLSTNSYEEEEEDGNEWKDVKQVLWSDIVEVSVCPKGKYPHTVLHTYFSKNPDNKAKPSGTSSFAMTPSPPDFRLILSSPSSLDNRGALETEKKLGKPGYNAFILGQNPGNIAQEHLSTQTPPPTKTTTATAARSTSSSSFSFNFKPFAPFSQSQPKKISQTSTQFFTTTRLKTINTDDSNKMSEYHHASTTVPAPPLSAPPPPSSSSPSSSVITTPLSTTNSNATTPNTTTRVVPNPIGNTGQQTLATSTNPPLGMQQNGQGRPDPLPRDMDGKFAQYRAALGDSQPKQPGESEGGSQSDKANNAASASASQEQDQVTSSKLASVEAQLQRMQQEQAEGAASRKQMEAENAKLKNLVSVYSAATKELVSTGDATEVAKLAAERRAEIVKMAHSNAESLIPVLDEWSQMADPETKKVLKPVVDSIHGLVNGSEEVCKNRAMLDNVIGTTHILHSINRQHQQKLQAERALTQTAENKALSALALAESERNKHAQTQTSLGQLRRQVELMGQATGKNLQAPPPPSSSQMMMMGNGEGGAPSQTQTSGFLEQMYGSGMGFDRNQALLSSVASTNPGSGGNSNNGLGTGSVIGGLLNTTIAATNKTDGTARIGDKRTRAQAGFGLEMKQSVASTTSSSSSPGHQIQQQKRNVRPRLGANVYDTKFPIGGCLIRTASSNHPSSAASPSLSSNVFSAFAMSIGEQLRNTGGISRSMMVGVESLAESSAAAPAPQGERGGFRPQSGRRY